jgi:hypothetical protein
MLIPACSADAEPLCAAAPAIDLSSRTGSMTTLSPPTPAPSTTSTFTATDAPTTPASPPADAISEAAADAMAALDPQGLLNRLRDEALDWVREEPLKAVALAAAAGALLALCLPSRSGPVESTEPQAAPELS